MYLTFFSRYFREVIDNGSTQSPTIARKEGAFIRIMAYSRPVKSCVKFGSPLCDEKYLYLIIFDQS